LLAAAHVGQLVLAVVCRRTPGDRVWLAESCPQQQAGEARIGQRRV